MCELDRAIEQFEKNVKCAVILFSGKIRDTDVELFLYKNDYVHDYRLVLRVSEKYIPDRPVYVDVPFKGDAHIEIDKDHIKLIWYIDKEEAMQLLKTAKLMQILTNVI